jgi:hypothetical protein
VAWLKFWTEKLPEEIWALTGTAAAATRDRAASENKPLFTFKSSLH